MTPSETTAAPGTCDHAALAGTGTGLATCARCRQAFVERGARSLVLTLVPLALLLVWRARRSG